MAGPSSLSNVVSSLVRAQVGSSIPENTLDEELDKRVAELILKEARKKEERYGRTGSHSPQLIGNAAKTNKRFLSSIIKRTDEHNKAVLRAQAEAANEAKKQKEREEREERMRRAQEAASARYSSPFESWRSIYLEENRDCKDPREVRERTYSSRHHRRRRDRHSDAEDDYERRKKRPRRSESPDHRGTRIGQDERKRDDPKSSHKRERKEESRSQRKSRRRSRSRSRSRSPSHSKHRKREEKGLKSSISERHSKRTSRDDRRRGRSRSRSPDLVRSKRSKRKDYSDDDPHSSTVGTSSALKPVVDRATGLGRRIDANRQNKDSDVESDEEVAPYPESSSSVSVPYLSKMDKYFAKDYDPRLDTTSSMTSVDGFIPPGAFDSWDYMLQVVKQRQEEKEERKRLEKLHRGSSGKIKKDSAMISTQNTGEMADLLSMQYTKRGGVREWDEGKKLDD